MFLFSISEMVHESQTLTIDYDSCVQELHQWWHSHPKLPKKVGKRVKDYLDTQKTRGVTA